MQEYERISEDDIIDDVLGENPRASQLRLLRVALVERHSAYQREIESSTEPADRKRIARKIKVVAKQIEALRQEEGIAEFVENSVRVTLNTAALDDEE